MSTSNEFRELLGTALNNTSVLKYACKFLGDSDAAREVSVDLLITAIQQVPESERANIATAIVNRTPFERIIQEIDANHFRLGEARVKSEAKAYILKPREENVLARDFSRSRTSPFASPSENPGFVMIQWLLGALTFEEIQVLLLLRFPEESPRTIAESLDLEEATVRTYARRGKRKLTARKDATQWENRTEDNEFIGTVPDRREFQRIYERVWRRSVRHLAYCLIGDLTGATRIADTVMIRAYQDLEEQGRFDVDTAWQGDNEFIGLKEHTFNEVEAFLIDFNEQEKEHVQTRPQDIWAKRVKERLTTAETKCFLLTFFHRSDDNGIADISNLTGMPSEKVKRHIQRAVRKMLSSDWRDIE